MAERINKDAFIANILECFTLLQTYEECYKEILDIIDAVNGLNESDLTIADLKNLIEGSEYISFDDNEAGTKLVISLDRTHLDNVPIANSTHLVTSGGVQKSIANTQSALENTIDTKTQGMLKLPINIPTEPLVVMVDTNKAQTNVPLGSGLAIVNNHLVATGGGGTSDVTKEYVDAQDQTIKSECNKYTDDKVADKVDEFNLDPSVVGEDTRFAYVYSYKNGTSPLELTIAPSAKVTIPLRNAQGHMLTKIMTDEMMASEENNQVVTAFGTLKKYTQYHYANLNSINVFPKYQQFLKPNKYSNTAQHIESVFEATGKYGKTYQPETAYMLGTVTQTYEPTKTDFTTMFFLTCNVLDGDKALRKYILTETEAGNGLTWNPNNQKLNVTYPIVKITQAAYDTLTTKNSNTLYVIVG